MKHPLKIRLQPAGEVPLYEQIRRQLARYASRYPQSAGQKLPEARQLAEEAGVSAATVLRAMDLLVRDGVCERRAGRGVCWVGMRAAQSVATASGERPRKACFLLAPHGDGYHPQDVPGRVYPGARERAAELGADLILLATPDLGGYLGNPALQILGNIVVCRADYPGGYEFARRYPQYPCVFTNYQDRDFLHSAPNVRGVFNDDYAGGFQAGIELLRRGLRRLLVLTMPLDTGNDNYEARVRGCCDAVRAEAGGAPKILTLRNEDLQANYRSVQERIAQAMAEVDPEAIFCVNDALAVQADEALARRDATARVELCGYDYLYPTLSEARRFTTLRIDYAGMGRRAVDLLLEPERYPKFLRLAPQLMPCWRLAPRQQ